MPRPRLPWFKFWVAATRHEKVAPLSDRAFRTWVELLDAGSQQPTRGHFKSIPAAAAVVRRPLRMIQTLVEAGLLDERPDGVWLHDWREWQRWAPEPGAESLANHTDKTPESLANGSGKVPESLTNHTRARVKT